MSFAKNSWVGILQLFTHTETHGPDSSRYRQRCTNTPCPLPTFPSPRSTSLTSHGPISHWHVIAVTHAFNRQDSSGIGLENMAANALGSQDGKRDLRILLVASWVPFGVSYLLFSALVKSINPSYPGTVVSFPISNTIFRLKRSIKNACAGFLSSSA